MATPYLRNLTRVPATSGRDVSDWQDFLTSKGYNPGPSDGSFGPGTEDATKQFQTASGLLVDGKVGNNTYAAAIAAGFQPLRHVSEPTPSSKVGTLTDVNGVTIYKLTSGQAVFFTTRMHVDADGCPEAYHPKNTGIENLANATKKNGSLSSDVIVFKNGVPFVQTRGATAGYYVSQTSLRDPAGDPTATSTYVDALKTPYIVLPGGKLGAARVGDVALIIDSVTGSRVKAIVADAGPVNELGEASIYCAGLATGMKLADITSTEARRRGSFINPRSGGTKKARFRYIVFPGTRLQWPKTNQEIAARVDGAMSALTPDQITAILA